ncbi:MAG: trypsin-like peptidase domain-containing protein [Thermoguttaceae bacterium]|nr:trypsin-like peptidase domain-containing protein [Thermoguttaceae bacterium]
MHLVLATLAIGAYAAVTLAAFEPVPPAVLEAEAARVAVMDGVKDSVLAIFSPSGRGGGSGVVITPDGFALTNYHVVKPCGNAMKCGMADGKLYDAVIVGVDPVGDVALIKLFGRDDFPIAELGDSDQVRVGDECFAMGNPFVLATDFQPTVTWGIVSGTQRYQYPAGTLLEYADCIQTDASINPGNSGGPLFDARGRLIGINGRASFEKRGRVNVGVAYAISINQIKHFLGQLHSGRILDHATLGATVVAGRDGAVVVNDILEDSDAYRRGLRYNSEIISFGGRTISTPNQFKNVLGIYPKGWRVPLSFREGGARVDTVVRLRGLHGEEELIRKVAESEPPIQIEPPEPKPEPGRPEDEPKPVPDSQENGGSKPGDDPDAPEREPGRPRRIEIPSRPGRPIGQLSRPPEPMPEIAKQHFETKRGFANYYFNKHHQDRILAAWDAQAGWAKATGTWTLAGQLSGGGNFELAIGGDGCRLKLPTTELDWTAPESYETDPAPPQSGGLFPALLLWRRLAVEGPESLEALYYLGTMPLPGHGGLMDVLIGQLRGVQAWFYFDPQSGRLLAVELFSDGDNADPCEVRLFDYRDYEGRPLPGRIEVHHGDAPYAAFQIDTWRFESSAPEPSKEQP